MTGDETGDRCGNSTRSLTPARRNWISARPPAADCGRQARSGSSPSTRADSEFSDATRRFSVARFTLGGGALADQVRVEFGRHSADAVVPVDRGAADELAHPGQLAGPAAQRVRALLEH